MEIKILFHLYVTFYSLQIVIQFDVSSCHMDEIKHTHKDIKKV